MLCRMKFRNRLRRLFHGRACARDVRRLDSTDSNVGSSGNSLSSKRPWASGRDVQGVSQPGVALWWTVKGATGGAGRVILRPRDGLARPEEDGVADADEEGSMSCRSLLRAASRHEAAGGRGNLKGRFSVLPGLGSWSNGGGDSGGGSRGRREVNDHHRDG